MKNAVTISYRLLGPLEVRCNGRVVPAPAGKKRSLLALLLLDPDGMVGRGALIDAVRTIGCHGR